MCKECFGGLDFGIEFKKFWAVVDEGTQCKCFETLKCFKTLLSPISGIGGEICDFGGENIVFGGYFIHFGGEKLIKFGGKIFYFGGWEY